MDGLELRKMVEAETGASLDKDWNLDGRALYVLLAHDYCRKASYAAIKKYLQIGSTTVYSLARRGYKLAEKGDSAYKKLVAQIEQQGGVKLKKRKSSRHLNPLVLDKSFIESVLGGRKLLYSELVNAIAEKTGRCATTCQKSLKPCFSVHGGFILRDEEGRFYLPEAQNDKK